LVPSFDMSLFYLQERLLEIIIVIYYSITLLPLCILYHPPFASAHRILPLRCFASFFYYELKIIIREIIIIIIVIYYSITLLPLCIVLPSRILYYLRVYSIIHPSHPPFASAHRSPLFPLSYTSFLPLFTYTSKPVTKQFIAYIFLLPFYSKKM
jgi:hypothetical protein